MLGKLLVVFATCVAQGLGDVTCVNGSSTFDNMLQGYRTELQLAGLQYVNLVDSNSEHHLAFLGVNLPLGVSLDLSGGVLGPLDQISRTNEAEQCTSGISTSITSIIKYDNLTLTFNTMSAKFLFWEMEGKTTINFAPCISTAFTNVGYLGNDCSMTFFEWQDTCDPNFDIAIPNNSWTDSFVGFFVRRVFNSSPLPQNARNKIKTFVNYYLTKYWCYGFGL
uniref:TRMT1-like protein n=1 Tax=Lygus hesperus TaxID=30085 RepID=A0A0A9X5G3_LYGHE